MAGRPMDQRSGQDRGQAAPLDRAAAGLALILLGLWLFCLAAEFAGWLATLPAALAYPYQLDYGEGIVWQQARMILRGEGYSGITELPYVVFHYPPVYHLLSGLLAGVSGLNELATGRLVSIAATLGFAAVVAALVFTGVRAQEGRLPAALCAVAAGLMLFSFEAVTSWGRLMRVDMVAILLSFLGVWLALGAPERPWRAVLATVAFVAAMFAKQTMIAPPLAMLVVLLMLRPRLAAYCALGGVVAGLLLILVLNGLTDGGFSKHVISYNINRMSAERLVRLAKIMLRYLPYVLIVLYFFRGHVTRPDLRATREKLAHDPYERLRLFSLVYYALGCLMLLLLAKVGSSVNYFLDWALATSLAIGLCLARPVRAALDLLIRRAGPADAAAAATPGWRRGGLGLAGLVALLLVQFVAQPRAAPGPLDAGPEFLRELGELRQFVSAADKPVLSDEMVLLLQAGKEVLWEPAIFAELSDLGRWDDGPLLEMIRAHQFAFLVTAYDEGHWLFDDRYTDRMQVAIRAAYPRKRSFGHFVVHLPPE